MIIRSQDKRSITTDLKLHISECDFTKDNITYRICTSTHDWLGTYSTEEKEVKVLDMIQNKYFEHMTLEQNGAITGILEKPKVFLMPQDSEV